MTNIVVVDDHPLVMKGIEKVVQKMVDMQVIGEASNWKQLQNLLSKQLPDIIILDLNLPGKNGLDILKDINVMYPSVPVIDYKYALVKNGFAVRSFKAGAMGYLRQVKYSGRTAKSHSKNPV
ncbi:MAG: response regulator transcription factor [Balneolaceae bacterium]|nr:response regulator transcription factor [Balneolaceae bacterium]